MIFKSKRRFVGTLMIILVFFIVAILGIIYFTTGKQTEKENQEMLKYFALAYDENGFPSADSFIPPKIKGIASGENNSLDEPPVLSDSVHRYQVSTFYAVSFNTDGSTKELLNDVPSSFSDEELVVYAKSLLDSGKTSGVSENVAYLITYGDDYILVSMMDTVVIDNTISYLMKNMLSFGIIAVIILFGISNLIANWVMSPMEQAYQKQKQFISDAGHELKTPISTIGANATILARELPNNSWLENIIYENERMSAIITQLLDLARLEAVSPEMATINFSELCLANIMPFEATAFEAGIDFNYEIADDIAILGNQANLEKLISILTDNAISHCPPSGKVRILLRKDSGKIKLSVANTGDEIALSDREKIFERFYKTDSSHQDTKGHYGLGLSIAKAIVLEHKGKIWVDCRDGIVYFNVVFS